MNYPNVEFFFCLIVGRIGFERNEIFGLGMSYAVFVVAVEVQKMYVCTDASSFVIFTPKLPRDARILLLPHI